MSKTCGAIKYEKELGRFKFFERNRSVDEGHVKRLMRSIQKGNHLHLSPIIVTSKFEVVDGQHRLEAAKKLNLGVYYIVDDAFNFDTLVQLNTSSKKWGVNDYINYWAKAGKKDYKDVMRVAEKYGVFPQSILYWVIGTRSLGTGGRLVQEGELKFEMDKLIEAGFLEGMEISNILKETPTIPKGILSQRVFHVALRHCFSYKFFEREHFVSCIADRAPQMRYFGRSAYYVEQFVQMYNHGIGRRRRIIAVSSGKLSIPILMLEAGIGAYEERNEGRLNEDEMNERGAHEGRAREASKFGKKVLEGRELSFNLEGGV